MVSSPSSHRKTQPYSTSAPGGTGKTAALEVGAASETGYVRKQNEDKMSGSHTGFGRLFVVADGMGGYKGGAYAASLTDKTITDYIKNAKQTQPVASVWHF